MRSTKGLRQIWCWLDYWHDGLPLSKKRVRELFKTKEEANAYKQKVEEKFKKGRAANYDDLLVEDLLVLFMQDHPKSDFTTVKRYMADFTETFGGFQIDEITTGALKAWLNQVQRENDLQDITMRGMKCTIDTFFR